MYDNMKASMNTILITKDISKHILMAGNYYKHHHPGGISAVVQYWSEYIDGLQYYPTYKLSNIFVRSWYFLSAYVNLTFRMLTDKNIKVLHLHTAADGSFWRKAQLVKLRHFFHKKVILHIHASRFKDFYNDSSAKKRIWIKNVLTEVDVLIVLSESWKQRFIDLGMPENKIVILHNITPYPTIMSAARKKNDEKTHFLFLGEIGQRKGVFDIIRGIAMKKEQFLGHMELKIGGNKNEEKLKKQIKDFNIQEIVTFEGWVSGNKKLELLNWADVFILPSFNEGLPISILEAMSYGMPIISTPVGGIPEVVKNNLNGTIISPGNAEEISIAMMKYIASPEIIKAEGEDSKNIVKFYLPEYVLNHLKNIYEKLINS